MKKNNLKKQNLTLSEEVDRLKLCMYQNASAYCGQSCPYYDYYDGSLCMVSGDYLEEMPSKECTEQRRSK
jgi:hypothetical protein